MAPHIQRPFLEHFNVNQKAEDILIAYELYNSEDISPNAEILKALILKYGFLASYSKALWEDFLMKYMNTGMMKAIMERL